MNTSRFARVRWLLMVGGSVGLLTAAGTPAQNSSSVKQQSTNPGTASGLQIPSSGTEHIRVVGHMQLEDLRVNQMFVEERGSKVYLYLHRPTKQAYALVDVTNPSNPVLVSRNALKEADATKVEEPATGSAFAITVTPDNPGDNDSASAPLRTETIQFVDMSNPKAVKSVKTFKGVTSIYPDDARKLVYLVNNEGLWIVSHNMTHPLPLCNSESALTPEPDCQ
jgi:hypothetical protein